MAKTVRVKSTLSEALDVKAAWEAVPDLKIGDVTLNDFVAAYNAADALHQDHVKTTVMRTGVKANRDDKVRKLNEFITRFRSTIRGVYGPDSPLYEQAGGTRTSARKSPARKAETVAAAPSADPTSVPDKATATHA